MKLIAFDTHPEKDPMHLDTQGLTFTQLFIDPRKGTFGLTQESHDNTTPIYEYNGLVFTATIHNYPDIIPATFEIDYVKNWITRIVDGWDSGWNGNNIVGSLNQDAQDALDALVADLEEYPSHEEDPYEDDND